MKFAALAAAMFALVPMASIAQPAIVPGPIVEPGATLEVVFDKGYWLEGPAAGPDGRLYFSDITMTFATDMGAGAIWVHDPATGATTVFRSPSGMSNGIKFDRAGGMIVAQGADFGGRQLIRTDPATGLSRIVAGLYNGRPFNSPNDLDIDARGRIYFTDPRYFGYEPIEQPVFGVYRIDTDGRVDLIAADATRPNGIAVSPDGRTLYVADNDIGTGDIRLRAKNIPMQIGEMRIIAYDLDDKGNLSRPRIFVDYGHEPGADGITVDRDGNLYAAVQLPGRFGVRVYDPSGKEIATVPTPRFPTNLALLTREGKTSLYVTAGTTLYRIATRIAARRYD